jgi:hypothetical protein
MDNLTLIKRCDVTLTWTKWKLNQLHLCYLDGKNVKVKNDK